MWISRFTFERLINKNMCARTNVSMEIEHFFPSCSHFAYAFTQYIYLRKMALNNGKKWISSSSLEHDRRSTCSLVKNINWRKKPTATTTDIRKNPIEFVLFVCVKCVFASTQCFFAFAKWICMNDWVSFYRAVIRNVNDAQEIIYICTVLSI